MIEALIEVSFASLRNKVIASCPDKPTDTQWSDFVGKVRSSREGRTVSYRRTKSRKELFGRVQRCPNCGAILLARNYAEGRPQVYCCDQCRIESTARQSNPKSKTNSCQQCGESFATSRSDAKYCSARCRVAFSRS